MHVCVLKPVEDDSKNKHAVSRICGQFRMWLLGQPHGLDPSRQPSALSHGKTLCSLLPPCTTTVNHVNCCRPHLRLCSRPTKMDVSLFHKLHWRS